MNYRDIFNDTLNFENMTKYGRGAVIETFSPWGLTYERWVKEGLPKDMIAIDPMEGPEETYLCCHTAEGIYKYETRLGFDGIKRLSFEVPFSDYEIKVIEETDEYILRRDSNGWYKKYFKDRDVVQEIKPPITSIEDWEKAKTKAYGVLEKYYTDENIKRLYSKFVDGHEKGDYALVLNMTGFFWTPRTLLGIEEHMLALYDSPELIHDINEFVLQVYLKYFTKVLDIIQPDLIYINEDLSGANGPMLSPNHFDEYVAAYYKRLIPVLKQKGVKHVFVDTDGDFNVLIPRFMEAGVDGFLPMDVNAGMDIVAVREKYPTVKFIGAFDKLQIAKSKESIDKEFKRLLPVIKQGGYIPGSDHQVAPSTSLDNYKYYIEKLKEIMEYAGKDN